MLDHRIVSQCLAASLLLIANVPAGAQGLPDPPINAVHPDVIALRTSADLVVRDLGFTALAEVTFNLVNRGDVGVNTATPGAPRPRGKPSNAPIQIDVLVGSATITIQQPALGGRQTRRFVVPLPSNVVKPKCLEARALTVRVDAPNTVAELHDDNNQAHVAAAARPCPDLAVVSIERDKEGLLGETYRAKVKIINQGNAPSPPTQVWGTALSTAPGITGWPEFSPTHNLPALQPGETTSFKIGGSVLSVDNSWVRIILDRFFAIDESDETNNFKEKKL